MSICVPYNIQYVCTYIHTCICAYLFWSRKFSDALKDTSFELVFRTQLLSHVSRSIHSKTLTDQPPNPTSRQVRQLVSLPPFRLSVAQTKICLHALYKYRSSSSRRHPPPPRQWLNAPVSKEHNRCRYTVSHTSKTLVKHRRRRAAHKNSHSSGGQSAHLVSLSDLNLYGRSQINIYSTFARVHSLRIICSRLGKVHLSGGLQLRVGNSPRGSPIRDSELTHLTQ